MDGGDSSDLAASDHMMEVDAGTAWVLPPQQEQVSAVAPEAMTPGCIVGIVFGVLLSLVVLLGKLQNTCIFLLISLVVSTILYIVSDIQLCICLLF